MGYSDVGAFGGEIRTPHIDTLAESGLRLTSFYVAPTCSPTRSMLMSGTDNHLAGLGAMKEALTENQKGQPGYEGHINQRVVTLATLLRDAGYHTYMSGKWHLGAEIEHDPSKRGFEKAYTLLQGGASHFDDEWMLYPNYTPVYRENGERVHVPRGFYSSEFYTDKLIEYIDAADDEKPFFAYLAFTSPHDPLHLPDEWLDKYAGRYNAGYEALRSERLKRMKKLGIVPEATQLSHRLPMIPEWDSLSRDQKRLQAKRMELHAGMIENVDHHLGRLFDHLKRKGVYDDTLILFFSDNGANPTDPHMYPGSSREWVERNSDNRFENLGRRGSRVAIGAAWALASDTPLRHFKAVHSEGGIRVPFIIAGPGVARTGEIHPAFTHVMDIAPTLLDLVGASHPKKHKGREVVPMQGRSMLTFLEGKAGVVRDESEAVGWELFGRRAIRQGRWKAAWLDSPLGSNDWQLFDVVADVSEYNDLADSNPEKLRELIALWEEYSDSVGVVLPLAAPSLSD
ncbi:MAG: arylsulfatase [Deltaproteobacteria bacterium]|nr:arylsulfatase [Deltaproteobacteria bacterium]